MSSPQAALTIAPERQGVNQIALTSLIGQAMVFHSRRLDR
jgi:hypothetical protein